MTVARPSVASQILARHHGHERERATAPRNRPREYRIDSLGRGASSAPRMVPVGDHLALRPPFPRVIGPPDVVEPVWSGAPQGPGPYATYQRMWQNVPLARSR